MRGEVISCEDTRAVVGGEEKEGVYGEESQIRGHCGRWRGVWLDDEDIDYPNEPLQGRSSRLHRDLQDRVSMNSTTGIRFRTIKA